MWFGLHTDMAIPEAKNEVYEIISKEVKLMVKREVKEQYDETIKSPEMKRPKIQHKGAESDGILNHVLKNFRRSNESYLNIGNKDSSPGNNISKHG